jgi:iron complex outermembrane receptor protein
LHASQDDSEIVGSTLRTPDALGIFTPPPGRNAFVDYGNVAGEMDSSSAGGALQIQWQLGDYELTSVTGYESLDRDYSVGDFAPFRLAEPTYNESLESFYQEIRISKDSESFYWMLGANYTDDSVDYFRTLSGFDLLLGELVSRYDQEDNSQAVFGQMDWRLTSNLELSAGIRYTDEEKQYDGGSIEQDPFGTSIVGVVFPGAAGDGIFRQPSYDDSDTSGQLKLSWRGLSNSLVYGMVSRGFKSGGFDGSGITDEAGFTPYDAETLISYEAGIKSRLLNDSLEIASSAYYYDYQDKQVLAIVDLGAGLNEAIIQNAAESEVLGLDVDATWWLTDDLTLGLTAVLLDSEVTDWNSDDPAEASARIGNELPGTPKTSVTSEVRWKTTLGSLDVNSALWVVYADSTYRDIANTRALQSDDYTLVNARLDFALQDSGLSFYLWGRNLTDEEYVTSVRDLLGMEGVYWGDPRTFGAGLRWEF